MKRIAILGSTGSIGTQTLDIVRMHKDMFVAEVLVAGSNVDMLEKQAREFKPNVVVIAEESRLADLKNRLSDTEVKVYGGTKAIEEVVTMESVDIVVAAMVGFAGLKPTLAAIKAHKEIALANKETLVVAGEIVMGEAQKNRVAVLPVDSEHSAIFQCLNGERHLTAKKIILTASGGPFRGWSRAQLEGVTPAQALKHPNWSMGAKVTIDSASLMNKGLESIEARWLFGVEPEKIEIVVHPQSIIHSMVEFEDGSVKAQLGTPDMRLPIQYALTFPYRYSSPVETLDFRKYSTLTFEYPDRVLFRNLQIAFDSMKNGGNTPCVMNGANEIVVKAFLVGAISFLDMPGVIEDVIARVPYVENPTVEDYFETDAQARRVAKEVLKIE
ncbi:MAG: 1-deoxy-D-xylulose-5-phosphate reductoisomerase [Marinilabiliaceae bacterium]|nr:1-deoxy-D-xylulose-5-phosphate reductoisomerase [Marinilabiliaceae bacterium]